MMQMNLRLQALIKLQGGTTNAAGLSNCQVQMSFSLLCGGGLLYPNWLLKSQLNQVATK